MALRADNRLIRAFTVLAIACTALAALALALQPSPADAKKKKSKKAASAKSLPSVKSVNPKDVQVGGVLTIKGKNFTIGKNKMLVIFKRPGSRRYTAKGTATSKTEMTVIVPDVSPDMSSGLSPDGTTFITNPTLFPFRLVNKYGMMKKSTSDEISPIIQPGLAVDDGTDCDHDKVPNKVDTDDDNDLLADDIEATIMSDPCKLDTDSDEVSDYYEYRVASEYNGGPILPYPWKRPSPDPLNGDSQFDLDGDHLSTLTEYLLWRYTGRMDRFYSDADQDSDNNAISDQNEDEDADLLTNIIELEVFTDHVPLKPTSFIDTDSDGDGLCDGLDDQDHDGDATPVSVADCSTPVPNNVAPGDPNASLTDGDDNPYSNIGEVLFNTDPYLACFPNPASKYCLLP